MPESTEISAPFFPKETGAETEEQLLQSSTDQGLCGRNGLWSLGQLQGTTFCISEAKVVILEIWMWF